MYRVGVCADLGFGLFHLNLFPWDNVNQEIIHVIVGDGHGNVTALHTYTHK